MEEKGTGKLMPYAIRESEGGVYEVINTETHEVKARHEPPDAKEKAEAQVELLHAVESDPQWTEKHHA